MESYPLLVGTVGMVVPEAMPSVMIPVHPAEVVEAEVELVTVATAD